MLHHDSLTILQREPCTLREKKLGLSLSSSRYVFISPYLLKEVYTIMFAHATEAAKRANKKISSRTVGIDAIVQVIHMVQQLRVDELCVGKARWPWLL